MNNEFILERSLDAILGYLADKQKHELTNPAFIPNIINGVELNSNPHSLVKRIAEDKYVYLTFTEDNVQITASGIDFIKNKGGYRQQAINLIKDEERKDKPIKLQQEANLLTRTGIIIAVFVALFAIIMTYFLNK